MSERIAHTTWGRSVLIGLGAAVAIGVVVLAFLWPTVTSKPQNLPIAITGQSAQVDAVTSALDKAQPGLFDVTKVNDRDAIVTGIQHRDYDGGIVIGTSPEVLTASAAGPAVTQVMTAVQGVLQKQVTEGIQTAAQAGAQAAAAKGATGEQVLQALASVPSVTVKLSDVVPLASTDSRGTGISTAAFPLALGGMIGGVLISVLVTGVWRRLAATVVYALAAAAIVVSVLQPWFGILQGSFLANFGAMALAVFATASFIVGMSALIGPAGIAVGAVVTVLIGNPLSSAAQPPQFLPEPWGAVGQWFVPGAATTLLRDLSYFTQASIAFPVLVLAGWAALGVLLQLVGHFRSREVVHVDGWDDEDAVAPAKEAIPVG
ncbi:membrane protein [Humibacter soli]